MQEAQDSVLTAILRSRARVPLSVLLMSACTAIESTVDDIGTAEDELFYNSVPDPAGDVFGEQGSKWPTRDVPVCFEGSGNPTERSWIRQAVNGEWGWRHAGNVNFVGWAGCGANEPVPSIRISHVGASTNHLGYLADTDSEVDIPIGINVHQVYGRCVDNSLDRKTCIQVLAVHEFGHALGFAHEQNRPDAPGCALGPDGPNGDTGGLVTPYDAESIMNYCNSPAALSGWDRSGMRKIYGYPSGDDRRLYDYTGDGRADAVIHRPFATTTLDIHYAATTGALTSTQFTHSSQSWCFETGERLLKGFFNSGSRADLMCFNTVTGTKQIDYANSGWPFFGDLDLFGSINWTVTNNWCIGANQRIHVGDFNGDGLDDMLCHDASNGYRWVDYNAGGSTPFAGTDVSSFTNWCAGANQRLYVGYLDSDSKSDLLCQDFDSGSTWIDHGSNGIGATDWSSGVPWCGGNDGYELFIGDFNGDGVGDLLCHDNSGPNKYFDYSVNRTTDLVANNLFCWGESSLLFIGDTDNDGKDDLVCRHPSSGYVQVDLANDGFAGVDYLDTGPSWSGADANFR